MKDDVKVKRNVAKLAQGEDRESIGCHHMNSRLSSAVYKTMLKGGTMECYLSKVIAENFIAGWF